MPGPSSETVTRPVPSALDTLSERFGLSAFERDLLLLNRFNQHRDQIVIVHSDRRTCVSSFLNRSKIRRLSLAALTLAPEAHSFHPLLKCFQPSIHGGIVPA